MKLAKYILLSYCLSSFYLFAAETDKKPYTIMKQVREQSRLYLTQSSEVYMVIIDKEGRTRDRYFNHLQKIIGSQTSSMVKFFKPVSIKGASLLSISQDGVSGADQWIYLPAFGAVKKLSSDDKGQSFMGSDFTNSDIAGRQLDQDTYELLQEDKDYYYIMSTPKDKTDSYSKLLSKISKKVSIPIEVQFFDQKNELLKTMYSKKISKIKDMYVVVQCEMLNAKTGGKTTLDVSEVQLGINIADSDVGIKGLKQ